MGRKLIFVFVFILSACVIPVDAPPDPTAILPDASQPASPTRTPASATQVTVPFIPSEMAFNDIPVLLTAIPEHNDESICQDTRAYQLLLDFQTALLTRDGELLSSLINPSSGVGVVYIRNGNPITYFENIQFIFETTYEADWGLGAGSGAPVVGSFHEVVLPSLDKVFSENSYIICNQIVTGGATYTPEFPYSTMDFYSVHFPGTEQNGYLDWETWLLGMVRQESRPALAALVHFMWEP
ncbi:MAG: hypothetical protein H6635_08560 [Anaerolineales bacterium]|nr:hypothetical protein [Anaerolineales bacterium]MCB9145407.1 hypothetical protein [Anaerolineales bacterium]